MFKFAFFCLLVLQLVCLCAISISRAITFKHNTHISVNVAHFFNSNTRSSNNKKKYISGDFSINSNNIIISQPYCQGGNGSITGLVINNNTNVTYNWTLNGKTVGTGLDLLGVSAGAYTLTVTTTDLQYTHTYGPVTLRNALASFNVANMTIVPSTCGQANGAITGIKVNYADRPTYQWTDALGNVVSTSLDAHNLPPGNYILLMTQPVCGLLQYSSVVVPNNGGPVIDDSKVVVTNNDCFNTGGSIKNIKATGVGVLKYTWINLATNLVAGTDADLNESGLGRFILKVTDDSGCGPAYSNIFSTTQFTNMTPVVFSSTGTVVKATCSTNASVTGITIAYPMIYEWFSDYTGQSVSKTADLLNVDGGTYTLQITDACGFNNINLHYDLGAMHLKYNPFQAVIKNSCPGQNSGSISLNGYFGVIASCRWLDGKDNVVGTTTSLTGLGAGTYRFFMTDSYGCESLNNTFTVVEEPAPAIDAGGVTITNDQCNTHIGSVTGAKAVGGTPPYSYAWTTSSGDTLAKTADITGLGAGTYWLTVMDYGSCPYPVKSFNITNTDVSVVPPAIKDINICSGNAATLIVQNPANGSSYRLYTSPTAFAPIDEQLSGRFDVTVSASTSFYISRVTGGCESERTKVNVKLNISLSTISNAISPNGDGINDTWKIAGMENYPAGVVQIFDRSGQKIFSSTGYSQPFDGTYNGAQLPTGTYYYMIDLKTGCNILSGSLTIIR